MAVSLSLLLSIFIDLIHLNGKDSQAARPPLSKRFWVFHGHRSLDYLLSTFCGSEGSSEVVLCTIIHG